MAKITALTQQKRNKNRVNVYLDGTFAFGLEAITAVWLRVGQELSPAEIDQLQANDELEKAKQAAMTLISYRPRSVAEVRRRLLEKGYSEAAAETAVSRLQELDLLNDHTFAAYWIDQRNTFKPRSRLALRDELHKKGVPPEIIDMALEAVDETNAARTAAQKHQHRWQRLPDFEFRQKASAYLQRRGFSYGIVRETVDWLLENREGQPDDDSTEQTA